VKATSQSGEVAFSMVKKLSGINRTKSANMLLDKVQREKICELILFRREVNERVVYSRNK
jgi:hypothetical protein